MNLHEYQAKQLLAEYGLPVSKVKWLAMWKKRLQIADKIRQRHAGW